MPWLCSVWFYLIPMQSPSHSISSSFRFGKHRPCTNVLWFWSLPQNSEEKNNKYWRTNCKEISWAAELKRRDFEYNSVADCELWAASPLVTQRRLRGSREFSSVQILQPKFCRFGWYLIRVSLGLREPVYWLRLSYLCAVTEWPPKPFSQVIPLWENNVQRITRQAIWEPAQSLPNPLIYSHSVPPLKITVIRMSEIGLPGEVIWKSKL